MTFYQWWDSDERLALYDEGEQVNARAAWNTALSLAAIKARLAQAEPGHNAYEEIMAMRALPGAGS